MPFTNITASHQFCDPLKDQAYRLGLTSSKAVRIEDILRILLDNWKMQRIQATVSYNCHLPYYPVDQEFLIKQKLSLYFQSFDQSLEWGQW